MGRLSIFVFLLIVSCGVKQEIVTPVSSTKVDIAVSAKHIYTDKFDKLYLITSNNEIHQYNTSSELLYKYANTLTGPISHLDVTNPQKILAHVKDFNTILILDNTLSKVNTLNLTSLNYPDVTAAATSNDGNYWLYDEANWRLIKVNDDGSIVTESNRLTDYDVAPFSPIYLLERENKVLMSTDLGQVLLFDNFGQYLNTIPLPKIGKFLFHNNEIQYCVDGSIHYHNIELLTDIQAKIAAPRGNLPVIDFDYTADGLIMLTKAGVIISTK